MFIGLRSNSTRNPVRGGMLGSAFHMSPLQGLKMMMCPLYKHGTATRLSGKSGALPATVEEFLTVQKGTGNYSKNSNSSKRP